TGMGIWMRCVPRDSSRKVDLGHGRVDDAGRFNVTLTTAAAGNSTRTIKCRARIENTGDEKCPIRTAVLKKVVADETMMVIEFDPRTCQSAFFWPFFNPLPNVTFSPAAPPEWSVGGPPIDSEQSPPEQPRTPPQIPQHQKPILQPETPQKPTLTAPVTPYHQSSPPPAPLFSNPVIPTYHHSSPPPAPLFSNPVIPP
ncbi:hypothetical protein M569_16462, partial [Genlisea aurea]